MRGIVSESECGDKVRILTEIIRGLQAMLLLAPNPKGFAKHDFGDYVHFANYRKPVTGDLVICQTSGIHPFTIGWLVSGGNYEATIREIGTDRTCRVSNDSFVPIEGLGDVEKFEGSQREFFEKVRKAIAKGGSYWHRFGGLRFERDEAIVTIREAFGGLGKESTPYEVRMKWTKQTTIKAIISSLIAGGYGDSADVFRRTATTNEQVQT